VNQEIEDMSDWNSKIIDEFRARGGRGVANFGDRLLLLTTRGAKTGRAHTTPLAYHRDGTNYVIIASMGGAPRHPAWYHNLLANPAAEIEVGTEKFRVRATAIPNGPERDRLYEQQAHIMPGFREYEKATTRKIPVVVLARADEARQAA
jgi:deazaflavin-dependent oxidoreductase (nitroreductase family)